MYIPDQFKESNNKQIIEYIINHPFGVLVSNESKVFHATHIPFEIETKEDVVIWLKEHFAAQNA